MKMNDMFPSNYLKKEDFPVPRVLTMRAIEMKEIDGDGGKEKKPVLHFHDSKPLILNKGNATAICELYGDDPDGWAGKTMEVYNDPSVMYAGKKTGGIRLRAPGTANNTRNGSWTLEEAITECGKVGITKDALFAHLKGLGRQGWKSARDTPTVVQMVAEANDKEVSFDSPAPLPPVNQDADDDRSIPF